MNRSNLLLVLGATAVSLALAEAAVRFLPPDLTVIRDLVRYVDEPVGYRLKPNVRIEFDGLFDPLPETVVWETNVQRIRDDKTFSESSQHRRIATYGDSETFGWSVSQEATFQKTLERMADGVEVINFGVPGYNTTNIVHAMAESLPEYKPDLVVYLFNKNDFDLPVYISDTEFNSHLIGRIRFVWQITAAKDERKRIRKSKERTQVVLRDLARMLELAQSNGAQMMIGFTRWEDWLRLRSELVAGNPLLAAIDAGTLHLVNAEPAIAGIPRLDDHLAPTAHQRLAALLCTHPAVCADQPLAAAQY